MRIISTKQSLKSKFNLFLQGTHTVYCVNVCLVYGFVLSPLIIVSQSLSAVARRNTIGANSQNSCIIVQGQKISRYMNVLHSLTTIYDMYMLVNSNNNSVPAPHVT